MMNSNMSIIYSLLQHVKVEDDPIPLFF
jgi:hypothetical protein